MEVGGESLWAGAGEVVMPATSKLPKHHFYLHDLNAELIPAPDPELQVLWFLCPLCPNRHYIRALGSARPAHRLDMEPVWEFRGELPRLTVTPSLDFRNNRDGGCVLHCVIEDGILKKL